MIIELMACRAGCGRVIDQFYMPDRCKCGSRFFTAVNPDILILVKWFIQQPIHVIKLVIQDLWEKAHE